MIRGSQKISTIFPSAIKPKANKGYYTQERDACLCYRYYYHHELCKTRTDEVLIIMEREFFISGTTIMARLVDYSDLLKDIVNNKPSKSALKRKYPQFNWL